MVTNQELQNEFQKFLDGEKLEWQLLKVFFQQNDGFSRRTADKEKALGMTAKEDQHLTISFMTLTEEDGTLYAEEDDAIKLDVDEKLRNKIVEMVRNAEGVRTIEDELNDPDNHDNMFK